PLPHSHSFPTRRSSDLSCQSENISETGMLLRSPEAYPIGTRVRFECTLPGDRSPLRGEAEVVRHTVSEVEQVQGIGVKVIFWKRSEEHTSELQSLTNIR